MFSFTFSFHPQLYIRGLWWIKGVFLSLPAVWPYSGILARRDVSADVQQLNELNIGTIDIVFSSLVTFFQIGILNLYIS